MARNAIEGIAEPFRSFQGRMPCRQGKLETAGLHHQFESNNWKRRASSIPAHQMAIIGKCLIPASLSTSCGRSCCYSEGVLAPSRSKEVDKTGCTIWTGRRLYGTRRTKPPHQHRFEQPFLHFVP